MNKRIISAILLAASLLTFTACASDSGNPAETTTAQQNIGETTEAATTEARITPDLPEADFEGYNFRVLTKGTTNIHWKSRDIAAEEQNGDPINDAVFERNSKVGEQYNFTVSDIPMKTYGDWAGSISTAVLSGENMYDMFAFHSASGINNGYLYDLYEIPHLDLSAPYYDQNTIKALTLGGKLYAATGDMLIMDNDATICVQFNKKLAEDYDFEKLYNGSLYTVVNEGRWTLDLFYESIQTVADDLNGNGEIDYIGDRWGFQSELFNRLTMLNGSGEYLAKLNSDGYPEITIGNDRAVTILNLIEQIQENKRVTLTSDDAYVKYPTDVWGECLDKNFTEGRVLYGMAGLVRVTHFRTMDIDFGILPIPKYEETQDEYYNTLSVSCANYISLPATLENPERTGIIIEALSCESMYTLTPAYYDITLNGKAIRDEESSEMLDIILGNTVIDIGFYFGWGNLYSTLKSASTFVSQLEANTAAAEQAIETTMDAILG